MSLPGLVCLAFVWSGILWLAATLLCRLKPSPRAAQAIWRVAAAMVLAPFAASLVVPVLPQAAGAALPDLPVLEPLMVAPVAGEVATKAAPVRLPDPATLVVCILIIGWTVRLVLWIVSQVRLQRLKRRAFSSRRDVRHWAEALGIRRAPDVRIVPAGPAFLAGVVRRSIYVPSALAMGTDTHQILVHELVHLKRGDLVARPLERLVADIFWFSPFAWWIRDQLDYWREAAVDEAAAEITGDRIAYARALTSAARVSRLEAMLPVAAFTLRKEGTLKMRLTELLTEPARRPRRLGLAAAAALLLATPLALAQGMLIKGAGAAPGGDVHYGHAVLDKATLTSAYGARKHPITEKPVWHNGTDLAAPEGVPVYAPTVGTVTLAGEREGYGKLVVLQVSDDVKLRFAKLSDISVEVGDVVNAGDVIGKVGQTGEATGPHLHFEVWHGAKPNDPQDEPGLILADDLTIMASSGAKPPVAPLAPAAPAEPVAPLAPEALEAPPAPAAPAPPEAPEAPAYVMPAACMKQVGWIEETPLPADWAERLTGARAANRAAGLKEGFAPEPLSPPHPSYPAGAASEGRSAMCEVLFDLGTEGLPKNAVARCSDSMFDASATELPGLRFEPVRDAGGNAVEVKGVRYPLQYCIG